METVTSLIQPYPASLEIPVQWGDMDAAQHVNNTVYLRWFESARIHYFNHLLNFMDFSGEAAVGPILAEVSCKYKIPVTFPDTVTSSARILPDSLSEFGFVMQHVIVSHRHGRIAAEGTARLVCYDYNALRKAPLPAALRERILAIEMQ
jgi:acyl-CoA thioester hydrolase